MTILALNMDFIFYFNINILFNIKRLFILNKNGLPINNSAPIILASAKTIRAIKKVGYSHERPTSTKYYLYE